MRNGIEGAGTGVRQPGPFFAQSLGRGVRVVEWWGAGDVEWGWGGKGEAPSRQEASVTGLL